MRTNPGSFPVANPTWPGPIDRRGTAEYLLPIQVEPHLVIAYEHMGRVPLSAPGCVGPYDAIGPTSLFRILNCWVQNGI